MMKRLKYIICLIITLSISVDICFAKTLNFIGRLVDEGGTSGGSEEIPFSAWKNHKSDSSTYQYRYKKDVNSSTSVSMNAYNMKGESVIPYSTTIEDYTFKAGTWIGINVTELHYANWKITELEYQKIKTKYTCNYRKPGGTYRCECKTKFVIPKTSCTGRVIPLDPDNIWEQLSPGNYCNCEICKTCTSSATTPSYTRTVEYGESYTCNSTYDGGTFSSQTSETVVDDKATIPEDVKTSMLNKAFEEVYKDAKDSISYSNGVVNYITNDKYPASEEKIKTEYIDVGESDGFDTDTYKDGGNVNTVNKVYELEKNYEILQKNVCMNLKTSEVTYGEECKTADGEIQIETSTIYDEYLKEDVDYWHYFIPLNTKSDQKFYLEVIKNENKIFPINQCETFLEENTDYHKYIIPVLTDDSIGTFIGDYHIYTDKTISDDLKTLQGGKGCNISTRIYFPIVQDFYNEVKDTSGNKKLKGFNFYYRPIDINNPFPNGVATNSLWSTWNGSSTKNPDISQSYNDITYIARNIDGEKIRNYTKDNPYTSWSNMNIDGTSKFIDSEGIVERNTRNSFYKLGCGPANENKYIGEEKNPLYIKGCDT